MRALTSNFDSPSPTDGFLGVLDQFAALRTYAGDGPAASGYRMLAPMQRARTSTRRAYDAPSFATLAARASARMRMTGFLSVLFVVGLGLAVLAGPANCPCNNVNIAQRTLARMDYVEMALLAAPRESVSRTTEALPTLSDATLVEPDQNAAGVSPITTSTIELQPSRETIAARREELGGITARRLPTTIIAASDAGPTVRVAALSGTATDALETLPAIEVETPPTKVTVDDDEPTAAPAPRTQRKRALRAYRTPVSAAGKHAPRKRDVQLVQRAPRWAQQMYVTPWQSQAFSYTR